MRRGMCDGENIPARPPRLISACRPPSSTPKTMVRAAVGAVARRVLWCFDCPSQPACHRHPQHRIALHGGVWPPEICGRGMPNVESCPKPQPRLPSHRRGGNKRLANSIDAGGLRNVADLIGRNRDASLLIIRRPTWASGRLGVLVGLPAEQLHPHRKTHAALPKRVAGDHMCAAPPWQQARPSPPCGASGYSRPGQPVAPSSSDVFSNLSRTRVNLPSPSGRCLQPSGRRLHESAWLMKPANARACRAQKYVSHHSKHAPISDQQFAAF